LALVLLAFAVPARARNPEQPETAPPVWGGLTFMDHSGPGPFWFGAEINGIFQTHPTFHSPYAFTNSFRAPADAALSGLLTVFFAYTPTSTTELILNGEMALGGGLSDALGIAGYPNLDVVRNPTLSHEPYLARAQVHQIVPLSRVWELNSDRGPISSFARVPRHRLEFRLGKMSTADMFDINPVASDSHMQFMNWAVDNNGAFDYAADTRGYTYGFVAEYQGPRVEFRVGEMLMPKVANGEVLDTDNLGKSRADNFELELKYSVRPDWAGTVRLLGYVNHANMGSYRDANTTALATGMRPDITASRKLGRIKYGYGVNVYQDLGRRLRVFSRLGGNDGKTESFAYTEIDNTFQIGFDVRGEDWRRPDDKVGVAFVTSGLSDDHREYLALGGLGFLLGDGRLNYGRETIVETYYNAHIWRGAFAAGDVQVVTNPGFNRDRGPVVVFALRGHLEF
jgi:hypothetical protein